jgi:hypothetical protein
MGTLRETARARVDSNDYYAEASRILKAEMARRDIGYKDLARLIPDENYVQLKTKINRGSFSAGFFIKILRAIGAAEIDVSSRTVPQTRSSRR